MKTYKIKIENQMYNYIIHENGEFESNYPFLNFDISRQIDSQIKERNIQNNQTVCLNLKC